MHCSVTGNSVLKLNVTVSTQHWAVGKGFWHTTFRANTFDMETNGTYTSPENMFVTVVRRFLPKNVYSNLKKYGLCLWYLFFFWYNLILRCVAFGTLPMAALRSLRSLRSQWFILLLSNLELEID